MKSEKVANDCIVAACAQALKEHSSRCAQAADKREWRLLEVVNEQLAMNTEKGDAQLESVASSILDISSQVKVMRATLGSIGQNVHRATIIKEAQSRLDAFQKKAMEIIRTLVGGSSDKSVFDAMEEAQTSCLIRLMEGVNIPLDNVKVAQMQTVAGFVSQMSSIESPSQNDVDIMAEQLLVPESELRDINQRLIGIEDHDRSRAKFNGLLLLSIELKLTCIIRVVAVCEKK